MLRLLSIRNFAVVEALEVEFRPGFTVLTGETGAGKSILLDALSLLLGDRFETRQLRASTDRAEIAAEFDGDEAPELRAWLAAQDLADEGPLLLRRVLDAQGRSRAYVNGRPATLAQLADIGERLIDLHGQHAHQSLGRPEAQRQLLDSFGGVEPLGARSRRCLARLARSDRAPRPRRAGGRGASSRTRRTCRAQCGARGARRDAPTSGRRCRRRSRGSRMRRPCSRRRRRRRPSSTEGDAALGARLAVLAHRLRAGRATRSGTFTTSFNLPTRPRFASTKRAGASAPIASASTSIRASSARVETRLAAFHDLARKYRVRPEALPALADETARRLAELVADSDAGALERAADQARQSFDALARELSGKRKAAALSLGKKVTAMMKELAMAGGRCEITLTPLAEPASFGVENRRIPCRDSSEAAARARWRESRRAASCRDSRWRSRWCWPKSGACRR